MAGAAMIVDGTFYSLAEDLVEATWRVGQRLPNSFGSVLAPMAGTITLRNHHGKYRTFAPTAQGFDISPGPEVVITSDVQGTPGNLVYCFGRSTGVLNSIPLDGNDIATIPFLGELGFLSQWGNNIFARLEGNLSTSAAWDLALTDAGYTGNRTTEDGATILNAIRVNRSALLGSNRRRVGLMDVARVLAQTEIGRIYDTQGGHIVFENRYHRSSFWASGPVARIDSNNAHINFAQTGSVLDGIINVVTSQGDSYVSKGLQQITFTPPLVSGTTYTIPPGGRTLVFTVDTSPDANVAFVQSWVPIVSGTNYTYDSVLGVPVFERGATEVSIRFPNPTATDQTATMRYIVGEPFRVDFRERVEARSQASIDIYGERTVQYPADLIVNRDEVIDHLNWAVKVHDGLQQNSKSIDPVRHVDVAANLKDKRNSSLTQVKVSDLITITEPKLGLNNAPFWVDEVEYQLRVTGDTHTIKMKLSDARASMMWPVSGMRFGYNTRVGL